MNLFGLCLLLKQITKAGSPKNYIDLHNDSRSFDIYCRRIILEEQKQIIMHFIQKMREKLHGFCKVAMKSM